MKQFNKTKVWLVLCLLSIVEAGSCWAETTYKLQQVTSVAAGEKYVFVQDTHAIGSTIENYTLQTVSEYKTNKLIGNEPYVWSLETATKGFYLMNESLTSDQIYLKNESNNLSFCSSSQSPPTWKFNLEDNDAFLVMSSSNYYLGYTGPNSYAYKAYAQVSGHPHEIRVYQLVEESAVTTKYTVTFDIGLNGTFVTDETFTNQNQRVEATAGAGIILPDVKANDGYTFKGWATSLGATLVDAGEAGANYKPTADCTLYAVYAPLHTYTFYVNGVSVCAGSVEQGASIPVPTTPEDLFGKKFAGWSTSSIDGITDAPSLVIPATTMGTADLTYFAVFATVSGENSWEEIRTNLIEDGKYAICTDRFFLKASINTKSQRYENGDVSPQISEGKLIVEPTYDCIWEISKPDQYYRIRNGSYYAGATKSENQGKLITDASDNHAMWSIEYANNKFSIINYGRSIDSSKPDNKYLSNNSTYGWATYSSSGGTAPRLFKQIKAKFSNYCTNFSTQDITLDESDAAVAQVNYVYRNIELKRTLKAGSWNTFCVPFDMSADDITKNLGDDAEVKQLEGLNVNDAEFNMLFGNAQTIEAGRPYMVRVRNEVSSINVTNKVVNTADSDPYSTVTDDEGNSLTFHGNYARMEAPSNSFIISNNLFYMVNSTVNVKGFRGYITTESTNSETQTRTLNYSFDSIVTGLDKMSYNKNSRIYDTIGRVRHKLQHGVNIVNGRKIIK